MNRAAVFLVVVGLLQMTGDLLEQYVFSPIDKAGRLLKGLGAATTASPSPRWAAISRSTIPRPAGW